VNVLGISAFYHDSAAALVRNGAVVAAAQEERFSRKKNDAEFPIRAVEFCLDAANIGLDEVDFVGFYDKPLLTFNRLLETYLAFAPAGFRSFATSMPVWVKEKVFQKELILKALNGLGRGEIARGELLFGFHHHSHAASAFYPSPFEEAAVVVMDGVGEWATTTIAAGSGARLELLREVRFPHSLGLLYSAFTHYLGFKVNDGEYKVMGLAPYGEPRHVAKLRDELIDLKPDGSFALDMRYFDYCTGLTMTNQRFADLFGGPPRRPAEPLTQRHMDLARSVQAVVEEAILGICASARAATGSRNLCLAGGVALNCVANGRILREGPFDRVWVQPASGDAGGALGVALAISHEIAGAPRGTDASAAGAMDAMGGAYLGPAFSEAAVLAALAPYRAVHRRLSDAELCPTIAKALADEKIVGWFQGRMEFGPRSLGNRSILADPRSARMQRNLNLKIKYRESFRPFAPAVLRSDVAEYFELDEDSPYMLFVAQVNAAHRRPLSDSEERLEGIDKLRALRSDIPAVTHVDGSARVQTVHAETNSRFHQLISEFKARTGSGLLVNTSFNVRDEPVVCTPGDAYRCMMGTEMDVLVIGNLVFYKEEQ
jgi:carbamoyltransferase